ncbi:hypothetical protein BJD12_00890 [Xanthomonas vesicatoria ATCC 35937]|nr:hypothetical protein BI313_03585 [Xanthomonas vesicatoria]APP74053.1 hypothetical protein BJD12_00890 [Xanthomonas vesicatoria ATCC 35937]
MLVACTNAPTNFTGACPLAIAGPLAAWMPPRSLQGRSCSVSCDGERARALQQTLKTLKARCPHRLRDTP